MQNGWKFVYGLEQDSNNLSIKYYGSKGYWLIYETEHIASQCFSPQNNKISAILLSSVGIEKLILNCGWKKSEWGSWRWKDVGKETPQKLVSIQRQRLFFISAGAL